MKFILKIAVFFLILPSISYAATPFTYLSCKAIVFENKTKDGPFKNNDKLKSGTNIGYYFYKYKEIKKKSKVMIHQQTFANLGWDWKVKKPKKYTLKPLKWDSYSDKDQIYTFVDYVKVEGASAMKGFSVQKINNNYHNTVTFSVSENNKNTLDIVMNQVCEKIDKSEYRDLIKNGAE